MNYELRLYRRARRRFALKTFVFLAIWLILALIQWTIVCMIHEARNMFKELYYICLITFALAIFLFTIFIYCERLRYLKVIRYLISFIIVELQIISLFGLVVYSWWPDVLTFYAICVLFILFCLVIGAILPRRVDLTLDVAIIFIISFILLMVAVFCLMYFLISQITVPITYSVLELSISIIIMLFVMYHTQTILGNRFAEMRLDDYLLGSLILFHDFLIIYWFTFYWQVKYRPITSDSYIETSTTDIISTTLKHKDAGFYDETVDQSQAINSRYYGNQKGWDRDDYPNMSSEPHRVRQSIDDWSIYRNRKKNRLHGLDRTRSNNGVKSKTRFQNRIRPTTTVIDHWHHPDLNRDRNDYKNDDIYQNHDLSPVSGSEEIIPDRKDIEKAPLDNWLTTYYDKDNVIELQTDKLILPTDNNYKISTQSIKSKKEHYPNAEFDYENRKVAKRVEEQITESLKTSKDLREITPEIVDEFKDEGIEDELIEEEPLTTVDATEALAYEKLLFTNKSALKMDL